jgi:hypothetical protein
MVEGGLVPGTTYYVSLHTADPGTTGASEVTGGSYARQAIVFTATGGGGNTIISNGAQNFTGMPAEASGVPYLGIYSASSGGTYLGGGACSLGSTAISAGATVAFAAGGISAAVS